MQLVVEDPACTSPFVILDDSTKAPETDPVVVLLVLWIILILVLMHRNGKHTFESHKTVLGRRSTSLGVKGMNSSIRSLGWRYSDVVGLWIGSGTCANVVFVTPWKCPLRSCEKVSPKA